MISNVVNNCSGTSIATAFQRISSNNIPNGYFLDGGNIYAADAPGALPNPFDLAAIDASMMQEYIAASVLIHASDGWNYLARSIESLMNGDVSSAIHLGYYGELRSAMSILAFEGVGILKNKHIWFDTSGQPNLEKGNTHETTQQCLEAWSKLSTKKDVLFKLVRINGYSLEDWINATGIGSVDSFKNTLMESWLQNWSIDLHLEEDKTLRNRVSYRPHFNTNSVDQLELVQKLSSIWKLLEPTPSNGFNRLDQHLLHLALRTIYNSINNQGTDEEDSEESIATEAENATNGEIESPYGRFVKNTMETLGESIDQTLYSFLTSDIDPVYEVLFSEARQDLGNADINLTSPLPLICRTILLLRLSTGAANVLVKNSGLNQESLSFWWQKLSFNYGITAVLEPELDSITDLYEDIRDCLQDFEINGLTDFSNTQRSHMTQSQNLFVLKQFQRTGIWGVVA